MRGGVNEKGGRQMWGGCFCDPLGSLERAPASMSIRLLPATEMKPDLM